MRYHREPTGLNQDDMRPYGRDTFTRIMSELQQVVVDKATTSSFRLPQGAGDEDDLRRPQIGLPADCVAKPKNHILVLKPQIALRSEADLNAIVLLAVEEISFKGFAILDEKGFDQVTADVMARNYVKLKGLQAFSPTDETMSRETGSRGVPRGLDFVPLEIFLDVRSEATDYDRIILKTDAAMSFDKFNHLRMPRGLEWPEATDENGRTINHLRIHQDLTSIVIPRLTVSATSKHYASLYNVVTNLLVYQDPAHVARSKQIDAFMFTFDRKDRDPQKLLTELFTLQQNIRLLSSLQQGYESNLDLLSETGKNELFKIRTDLLQATEQLFVVFEAISVSQAKEEARAALKSVTRLDAKVGGIAWHVLQDDFKPLAKFDVERAAISHVNNKDGSSDCGIVLGDLSALNSNADALFPEMVSRYYESRPRKDQRDPFITAAFSLMPPVGGISVFRDVRFRLHPVRLKIEKEVGEKIVNYFVGETKKVAAGGGGGGSAHYAARPEMPPLARSRSQVSVASTTNGRRRSNTGLSVEPAPKPDTRFGMAPGEDVSEMRKRASHSRTYLNINMAASAILLTWRGEGWFPDCTDLKIKTPALSYSNQTWSSSDIVDAIKKDVVRAGWKQLPDFLGQFWSHATWLRTKQHKRERELTVRADAHLLSLRRHDPSPRRHDGRRPSLPVPDQPLPPPRGGSVDHGAVVSYSVQPPTPLDDDGGGAFIRGSSPRTNGKARDDGQRNGSGPLVGLGISGSPASSSHGHDDDTKVGKAVKGLLTKLRPGHTASRHDLTNGSTDDLARTSTGGTAGTGPQSPTATAPTPSNR
ncbi:Protein SABRE [Cryptotrichosporon argae]